MCLQCLGSPFHFSLVKQANLLRGVPSWRDAGYRALMLRLQFRRPTANYVEQQTLQDPEWGKDDVAIMDRLAQCILMADAIEVRILRFEESIQLQGESLSDYMTRLQLLAGQAFAKEPADIVRKRVVWRFLSGLHDADVRSLLIREKWMESAETAKSYDEVGKIALAALSTKRATKATGSRNSSVHVNQIEGSKKKFSVRTAPHGSLEQSVQMNSTSAFQCTVALVQPKVKGQMRYRHVLSSRAATRELKNITNYVTVEMMKTKYNAENAVVIPPRTKLFICCSADGMVPDKQYLLCPQHPEGSPVAPPHCCIQGSIKKKMYVRVANVSDKHETVQSGEEIRELLPSGVGYDGNHSLLSSIEGKRGNFIVGEEMDKVLHEFKNVFYNGGPLPLVQVGVEHTIRVNPDSAPIANRLRRLSLALEAKVKELSKLQDMGVIKKSYSSWAAPIVCARRADGSLRLAIDYRGVNSVSQPATLHPIPVVEDLLDRLGQAKYFSVLDAKSGYHHMPLQKEDCEVSAFVVPWGQFEWHDRTPFGLKGAGYTFQWMMATILSDCIYMDALCYLDDILVWGST
ncbi:uncharacterized protein LOC135211286 [Macrobrachium nipponense]|uniref:uncharacterized protein LOC135211286 n=1 Tax=Macrobrachium nipponense TaxID=159736 RepID=UPI0030C86F18